MITKKPIISVCMPMYNASQYLRECIDSILLQTFTDFELLIVDDGSTDDSCDIVRSYNDSRIRLIENKHDYIASLNMLLDEAKGKYIARMDADDVMMPDRLEVQFAYMEKFSDIGVLATSVLKHGTYKFVYKVDTEILVSNQDLVNACPIVHPSVIIRKDILYNLNLKYEHRYIYAEDYRLWCQCLKNDIKILVVPYVGLKYRFSNNQITNVKSTKMSIAKNKVQHDFAVWLSHKYNKGYHKPLVKTTEKLLTVIIPFLNEKEEVVKTVRSLRESVGNIIDIIIINDQSTDGYNYIEVLKKYDVYYFLNNRRLGVAASRDFGVSVCKTPYFLLLDAHMRFYDSTWYNDCLELLRKDERQILCVQTKQLWKKETGEITEIDNVLPVYGAYATFTRNKYSPGIDWNYIESNKDLDHEDIPCILGAGYIASKKYWEYLKGLNGLIQYGSDEVYISLKVWLEGGKCTLVKNHSFGHIYRSNAPYQNVSSKVLYNNLLIAYTLFPTHLWCWMFACCKETNAYEFEQAYKLLKNCKNRINRLKEYYNKIFTKSSLEIIQKNINVARKNNCNHKELQEVARTIYNYFLENVSNDCNVVDGNMGRMIWLSLYKRYNNQECFDEQISDYLVLIEAAIKKRSVPLNFRYGLSGIGWGLIYMYHHKLIDELDDNLLQAIDEDINVLDLKKITDMSFYYGLGGLLSYIVCRIYYSKKRGTTLIFDDIFYKNLLLVSNNILKKCNNFSSCYYAYLYSELYYDKNDDYFIPSLSDWVNYPLSLPINRKFWEYSFDNGCLGYTLSLLE